MGEGKLSIFFRNNLSIVVVVVRQNWRGERGGGSLLLSKPRKKEREREKRTKEREREKRTKEREREREREENERKKKGKIEKREEEASKGGDVCM